MDKTKIKTKETSKTKMWVQQTKPTRLNYKLNTTKSNEFKKNHNKNLIYLLTEDIRT